MTTREHREIRTERVVQRRAVSPHATQLDNNLDSLLEDLQNSVSRPGSSLAVNGSGIHGGNYREYRTEKVVTKSGGPTGNTRIDFLSAANPITVPSEIMTLENKRADGGKEKKVYKTTTYEYNESVDGVPTNLAMQSNINQLDTLLDDLQHVRQGSNNNTGIDSALLDTTDITVTPGSTTRQVTTKKTVQRELVYDPLTRQGRPHQKSPQLKRNEREGSVTRDITYNINEGTYGDLRPIQTSPLRDISPGRIQTIETHTVIPGNTQHIIKNETSENYLNPDILNELDPNLLPTPSTKVTTTIKTYTYELPGTVQSTGYPSRLNSPPIDDSYNVTTIRNDNYNTTTRNVPSPAQPGWNAQRPKSPNPTTIVYKQDVKTVTDNTYPGPNDIEPYYPPDQQYPPGTNTTIIYKHDTINNRVYENPPPENIIRTPQNYPPNDQYYVYKHTETTTDKSLPYDPNSPHGKYPPNDGRYPPNDGKYPPNDGRYPPNDGRYPPNDGRYPPNDSRYPPNDGRYPPSDGTYPRKPNDQNINITYKYTSESKTSNNYKGYPPHPNDRDDREPLLQPGKFPTDPNDNVRSPQGGPPKRLDDLMASFNGPENMHTTNVYNTTTYIDKTDRPNKPNAGNQGVMSAKKAEEDKMQKKDIKDLPKTKNIAGPPVYYPPGHEMFAKKEESAAAYSAQGGYSRASGKYQYESESKSKSKSSSGAAVVPVCLPLCCAMPCVIL